MKEEGGDQQSEWDGLQPFLWRVTDIDDKLAALAETLEQFYRQNRIDGTLLSEARREEERNQQQINGNERGRGNRLSFAYGEVMFDTFFEYLSHKVH